mgnify:CR=1 FL=1
MSGAGQDFNDGKAGPMTTQTFRVLCMVRVPREVRMLTKHRDGLHGLETNPCGGREKTQYNGNGLAGSLSPQGILVVTHIFRLVLVQAGQGRQTL